FKSPLAHAGLPTYLGDFADITAAVMPRERCATCSRATCDARSVVCGVERGLRGRSRCSQVATRPRGVGFGRRPARLGRWRAWVRDGRGCPGMECLCLAAAFPWRAQDAVNVGD